MIINCKAVFKIELIGCGSFWHYESHSFMSTCPGVNCIEPKKWILIDDE